MTTKPHMAIVRCRDVYELPVMREATAFRDAGFDVEVVMLEGREGPAGTREADGIAVTRLRGSKSRNNKADYLIGYGAFLIRAAVHLERRHRKQPFRLVQVNTMPDFLVLCTVFLRLRGVKVSVFMKEPTPELGYTIYGSRLLEQFLTLAERLALRYSDIAFAVTPELRQRFIERGADPTKIHSVLNCPDDALFTGPNVVPATNPDRFVLVSHGTIESRWGHDLMVDAVRQLRDEIPEIELRLIGDGGHVGEVMEKVAQYELGEQVKYLGWLELEEVINQVAGADLGIVAQLSSPYSNLVHTNKMFEFIMLDVPCVASRLHSVSSAFTDDELMFFEPDDSDSLAKAILTLYRDPALRRRIAASARIAYEGGYRWADQQRILVDHSTRLLARG